MFNPWILALDSINSSGPRMKHNSFEVLSMDLRAGEIRMLSLLRKPWPRSHIARTGLIKCQKPCMTAHAYMKILCIHI